MLGILCGLESEAKIARLIPNAIIACSGANPRVARQKAIELVQKGATHLLSFGIAGGLAPDIPLGRLVVGKSVISNHGHWLCDEDFCHNLLDKFPHTECSVVFGSESLVTTPARKASLYDRYHARIVDMESQCVAEVASASGMPFSILRSVCDTATMEVPDIVMKTINPDGSINYITAITQCLTRPANIPHLIAAGRGTSKALKTLRKATAEAFL